ncbi:L,D-transpeptidase family protein [Nocardioides sambongensis]|uniref:L,D-transpeptidase family protein n=1 Tax=Nocardioides sambongensis TaxID=2589074 RepID=UPI0011261D6F|nr:L,D-transpeptidase family protein [Nocardioides sambongensis]
MTTRTHRTGRRVAIVVVLTAVLSLLAYGAGWAYRNADTEAAADARSDRAGSPRQEGPSSGSGQDGGPGNADDRTGNGSGGPADGREPSAGQTGAGADDSDDEPTDEASDEASDEPSEDPTDDPADDPADDGRTQGMVAGPALYSVGDESDGVREVQARLRQIDWFNTDVTGYYGEVTVAAVRGFQAKRGFPVTGEVDQRTLTRLEEMSTEPTDAELTNQVGGNTPGALDARCRTGRVLCIDKSSRTLRWVVDGTVRTTVDVRFGASSTPTREGRFSVEWKSRDHVSSLYGSAMPYAMFFSRGQAVHYSSDFAANGYNGASHGCVNVRDQAAIATLFDQVQVGDEVVVYWS